MSSFRKTVLATGLALSVSTTAYAADLYQPPILEPVPIEEEFASNWYLRGYVGVSNQQVDGLDNYLYHTTNTVSVETHQKGFDSAGFAGVGVGYRMNGWLRFDVTGEYRGRANFHGLDVYTDTTGTPYPDEYSGSMSEWLVLANAYLDFGSWKGISPYVGAGIGGSYNTIHDFRDVDVTVNSVAYAPDASKWDLAWALYAGIGYEVTPNLTMDLGYRYLHKGDAETGDMIAYDGTNNFYNPWTFEDVSSHDVFLGFRYAM